MDNEQIWNRLCEVPTREETRTIMREETRRCRRIQRKHCEKATLPPAQPEPKPLDWAGYLRTALVIAAVVGTMIGAAVGLIPAPVLGNSPAMPSVSGGK
jgi:hypothetical protein